MVFGIDDALIAACISAAGSMYAANSAVSSQRSSNDTNLQSVKAQLRFQDNMSRTAHQREVEDLKAAHLNPILSAGGSGAATPSGNAAVVQPDISPNTASMYSQIPYQVMDILQKKADIDNTNSATALNNSTKLIQDNRGGVTDKDRIIAEQDAKVANSWFGKVVLPWIRNTASSFGFGSSASVSLNKKRAFVQ